MNTEIKERAVAWAKIVEYYGQNYGQWAIRWLTEDQEGVKVGDVLRPSYEWDIENDVSCHATTGEMLPGTCGVELTEGSYCEIEEVLATAPYYGNDKGEVYVESARVKGL